MRDGSGLDVVCLVEVDDYAPLSVPRVVLSLDDEEFFLSKQEALLLAALLESKANELPDVITLRAVRG